MKTKVRKADKYFRMLDISKVPVPVKYVAIESGMEVYSLVVLPGRSGSQHLCEFVWRQLPTDHDSTSP